MNWTLEVVVVPVSDVEQAKAFYADQVGFHVDHDQSLVNGGRFVQLTPPGSGCSIVIGGGFSDMAPGSLKGVQLVVNDIRAARSELIERGVEVSDIVVFGPDGPQPAREDDVLNNAAFMTFADPDGNGWSVQQIDARD